MDWIILLGPTMTEVASWYILEVTETLFMRKSIVAGLNGEQEQGDGEAA